MTPNEVKTENETNKEPVIAYEKGVIMIPSTLDLQLQANAQKVHFNGLNLTETKGKLILKNTVATLHNTGFKLIGTTVVMNAKYQSITPEKAQFEYNIKADEFNIKRAYDEIAIFREMASAAEKAQGIISLEYQLKGRLNANMEPIYPSLTGNGIVTIKDIKLYGMKMFTAVARKTSNEGFKNPELSKVAIKTSVKNNIITVEKFKFKFASFRPRIEGTTSLDGKLNIKMRLGLPPLGIIGIPMVIKGDKDNPKVKIGSTSEDLKEIEDIDNK
jgi:AsmA protein